VQEQVELGWSRVGDVAQGNSQLSTISFSSSLSLRIVMREGRT
jgi:hypothetical protein